MAKQPHIDSEKRKIENQGKKTPLEFMLSVMWNQNATLGTRLEAAKSAAPYVHRKMPLEIANTGEVKIIPPFVPSKSDLRKDFLDELEDNLTPEEQEAKAEMDDPL
ncbi:hypothetical protein EKK58_07405 [Candidatus Dependentiae bacterium]|nr:MAG: hypothetical protein EKK58_07405 [Candidatus Dependentiae bacterium]